MRAIPDWYEVERSDVQDAKRRWQPWTGERLVLDAIEPPEANLHRSLRYLAERPASRSKFPVVMAAAMARCRDAATT